MHKRSIVELIEERIDQGGVDLPVFHRIAMKLQKLISEEDYGAVDMSRLVQKDQALTSHVLRRANSAFYAGLNPVTTIRDATVRLGGQSVLNIVMAVTLKHLYRPQTKAFSRWMNDLWCHALSSALASRWLALRLGLDKLTEEAFLAGLLHDIGKLLLLKIIEDLQRSGSIQKNVSDSVIDDILNNLHCVQGEKFMRQLNMPEVYCHVVARHHDEDKKGEKVMVDLVRLANLACRKLGLGLYEDPGIMLSVSPEAINLMASDLLLAELQVKLEDYKTRLYRQKVGK